MEISQARLEQDQARDSLTKARVTIHSFNPTRIDQEIQAAVKLTDKTHQEGDAALAERDYRRKGLGLSLFAIVAVVIGLRQMIRHLEQPKS